MKLRSSARCFSVRPSAPIAWAMPLGRWGVCGGCGVHRLRAGPSDAAPDTGQCGGGGPAGRKAEEDV